MATELRRLITGGGAVALAMRMASIGLGTLAAFWLARVLGPAEFGAYSFLVSAAAIGAVIVQFGTTNIATKAGAMSLVTDHWRAVARISSYSRQAVAAAGGAVMIGACGLLLGLGAPVEQYISVVSVVITAGALCLIAIHGAILRGAGHNAKGLLPELVVRPILFLALLLVIFISSIASVNATVAMACYATSSAIALYVCLHLYRRHISQKHTGFRISRSAAKRCFIVSIPFAAVEVAHIFNQQATALIGGLVTSDTEVGLIRVAVQFGMLVSIAFTALNLFVAPRMAQLLFAGERQKLQDLTIAAANVATAFSVAAFALLVVFGKAILVTLVGHEYLNSYIPLIIVAAGQIVNASTASVGALLMMSGNERTLSNILMIVAVASVPLYILLIGHYGALGAAAVSTGTTVVWNGWLVWAAYRSTGVLSIAGPRRVLR